MAGAKPDYSDRLGEFIVSSMLGLWLPRNTASAAASGWQGDRARFFTLPEAGTVCLIWTSNWQTPEQADRFFQALSEGYEKRFQQKWITRSSRELSMETKKGNALLQRFEASAANGVQLSIGCPGTQIGL